MEVHDWRPDAEENLPTQPAPAGQDARLSCAHENAGGPRRAGAPPGQGAPFSDCQFRTIVLVSTARFRFPKSARLLRSAEYRRIYDEGSKFVGPLFAAFYLRTEGPSRVGYTTPRALGGSVVRNRIKRRLREVVRVALPSLEPGWEIVFNPRRAARDAELSRLTSEVERLWTLLRAKGTRS